MRKMDTPRHQPRKRFGQNFLQDDAIIDNIVACIHPSIGEHLVEIGPGLGALTFPILKQVKQLDVVEIDRDLIAPLHARCPSDCQLSVHEADALQFSFADLRRTPEEKLRIIGNLPYNISTPILFHLLSQHDAIADMHFMLQREVVDRAVAPPGSRTYGRLSVMLQYYCEVECLFFVPPTAFYPQPKVESAIIALRPHVINPYPAVPFERLEATVATAFNQRRKSLSNALKSIISSEQLRYLGIDPQLRAEQLSVNDFVRITLATMA